MYQKYIEIVAQEVYIYTQYIHNGIRQIVEGQVNRFWALLGSKMKEELISGSENVAPSFLRGQDWGLTLQDGAPQL